MLDLAKLDAGIASREGFRPTAYQDSRGFWHVGFGLCIDSRVPGAGISREEAMTLLVARRQQAYFQLINAYHWISTLDPIRLGALTEMVYVMGIGDFRQFTKMIAAIWAQDWTRASSECLDSQWFSQDSVRCGLIADVLLSGKEPPAHG